jgi:hypothetical protein
MARKTKPTDSVFSEPGAGETVPATPTAPAGESLDDIRSEVASGTDATSDPGGTGPSSEDASAPTRRRRGRPKGSKTTRRVTGGGESAPAVQLPDAVAIAPIYRAVFGACASRWGDHWTLSAQEAETLASLTQAVLLKYQDAFLAKYGAEVVLCAYLGIVVGGRLAYQKPKASSEGEPDPVLLGTEAA